MDAAKHLDTNVMVGWSSKKLELMDVKNVENRFFVRMGGSYTENLPKVEEVFGQVDSKVLAEVNGEFAFITGKMTEAEYQEKAAKLDDIRGMIRVRF